MARIPDVCCKFPVFDDCDEVRDDDNDIKEVIANYIDIPEET